MIFNLPMPIGVNHLYKQGKNGWYKDSKAVDWQEQALWLIKTQIKGQTNYPGIGRKVSITWHRKDKRKFDIDGPIKLLLDTIVKSGIIEDDSMITELIVRKTKGNENSCTITIT